MKKAIVIILDGLGDRPHPALQSKTPLETAYIPYFDKLAKKGLCGLLHPLYPGIPVSTHSGMGLLFGIAPKDIVSLARGPVEAMGIELPLQAGDVILRGNFATLQQQADRWQILDRRAGRIQQGTQELSVRLENIDLGNGILASVYPTTQHRVVVRLRSHHSDITLSENISDTDITKTDPLYLRNSYALDTNDQQAKITAQAINTFSRIAYQRLQQHPINKQRRQQGLLPANGILCRSPGKLMALQSIFSSLHLHVAVVSAEATVIGLAKWLTFTTCTQDNFTALGDTNIVEKVALAKKQLADHDVVFLHIKGTDVYSHDKQVHKKVQFIERIDEAIADLLDMDIIIAVTADHSTNSITGFHSGDPVPVLLCNPEGRRDEVAYFDETSCMQGGLGHLSAYAFVFSLLDQMDCMHSFKQSDNQWMQLF